METSSGEAAGWGSRALQREGLGRRATEGRGWGGVAAPLRSAQPFGADV